MKFTRPGVAPGPDVYVTVRGDLALVRGWAAERAVRMTSGDVLAPWSDAGRGWVIDAATVPDVVAYCQSSRWLVVISDVTDEHAESA